MNFRSIIAAVELSAGVTDALKVLQIIFISLLIALAIGLIACIVGQSSTSSGMGAIAGQTTETFYSKNKGKSLQGLLKTLTVAFSIAILVLTVGCLVIALFYNPTSV